MANRVVTQALLHGPIFVPGVGQLSAQLATTSDRAGKIKSLTMEIVECSHLEVTVNGVNIGIPLANIQVLTFVPKAK